jgi:hypothetical protein
MADLQVVDPAVELVEEASQPYVHRWNGLVSTTNWEKGRIIFEWREALIAAGAGVQEYSDEAWASRIGAVSSQHVGRLRRVHERFAAVREQYAGIYWSHFQAALEWPDPELWLEGAVQNGWSVADMRRQRWQAYGAASDEKPRDADIVTAEFDEDAPRDTDAEPADARSRLRATKDGPPSRGERAGTRNGSSTTGPDLGQGPDFGAEPSVPFATDDGPPRNLYLADAPVESIRPFEHLPELPADLAEAMEMFKLSILRHKLDGWSHVAAEDVLLALDGLKQLVLAPAENE